MSEKSGAFELVIAERKLLFSRKGGGDRKAFSINIGVPYLVNETPEGSAITDCYAGCSIVLDGLGEEVPDVFGTDRLHALSLATDVDTILQRLQKTYDFFGHPAKIILRICDPNKILTMG